MVTITIIQSSLRKDSRTAVVMNMIANYLQQLDVEHNLIDLRDYDLPFCDGRAFNEYLEEYPDVVKVQHQMEMADAFIFGYPNYVYTYSGVFKNFIDIFGKNTIDKYFGMVVNAGGRNGYMASNDLISIMLYDFNATAIMPQVYTAKNDFSKINDQWVLEAAKPRQKITQMVDRLLYKVNENYDQIIV